MDKLPVLRLLLGAALAQHPAHVALADLLAAQRHLDADGVRGGMAARHIHDNLAHRLVRHLLGGMDSIQDRFLGGFHIDDGAGSAGRG